MGRHTRTGPIVACLLIALSVLSRVMPHPPNFTALAALAMFASYYLGGWKLGAVVPLISLVISDVIIGMYEPPLMAAVYAASFFPLLFGAMLRRRASAFRVVSFSLCSSITFFVTTNFGVWLLGTWYSQDWAGLTACYAAAVPFFRYTVMSDILFTSAAFGAYALAVHGRATWVGPARAWLISKGQVAARASLAMVNASS